MLFKFFELNSWQFTSQSNFFGRPSWDRKPVGKRYCVASKLFLLEECLKGDSSEAVF